jgi:light-regulated signal transduction histidine kinase (bacteriophytochrome)
MEQSSIHPLLKNQVETVFGKSFHLSTEMNTLLGLINQTYVDLEQGKVNELFQKYAADLEKKNTELNQFAYVVSHDLKSPLRGIHNLTSWIEEDLEGVEVNESIQLNLQLLRKRVLRMESLINGILQYSRAGRVKNDLELVSTYELVKEITEGIADKKVTFNIDNNLPSFLTERITLEQVLTNYISNAIKYNDKEDIQVGISAKDIGLVYEFCVTDNGPGIEPEFFEKIFNMFITLQPRDQSESTGVGLAIVKKIVEEKGGEVRLESELGTGSRFYFTWPKQ